MTPFITELTRTTAMLLNSVTYSGGVALDYVGVEQLVVEGIALTTNEYSSTWVTGETADVIRVFGALRLMNGAFELAPISIFTSEGDDRIYLWDVGPMSSVFAGAGHDLVDMSGALSVQTTAFGDEGNDVLIGGTGVQQLEGGNGDDRLEGGDGDDYLVGDAGADILTGGNGNDVLIGGDGIDSLDGGGGNDMLSAGEGMETLNGGDGDDVLVGGGARDMLIGGAGSDIYRYDSAQDSSPQGGIDTIYGFVRGVDKVDLSRIDANPWIAGDQAFHWMGAGAFTKTPGELRSTMLGVVADIDGDGFQDMTIWVSAGYGGHNLAGDFVL